MDFNQAVGRAVLALRLSKGLTQKDLLGAVSSQYLSDIERGKRAPSIAVLAQICERLEIHEAVPVILAMHLMKPSEPLHQSLQEIEIQLRTAGFIWPGPAA